jgi:hypothetical protein
MIFSKQRRRASLPGGFFHLEEEKTKTRVSGYGHGWLGSAERGPDNSVAYRFRDGNGRTLTGISENLAVTLRDEKGNTWKGIVD